MRFFKKTALVFLLAAGSLVGIASCKSTAKVPVTFVAVGSNTYDTEVTIGNFDYKFKGRVDQKSNSFSFEGKALQRTKPSSGGGQGGFGPGGGGWGPGGGGGGGQGGDPTQVDVHVTSVELDLDGPIDLEAGKTQQVNVSVLPAYASNLNVNWESTDPNVATAQEQGGGYVIKAVNAGTATLTVKSVSDPTVSDSIVVNVHKTAVTGIELKINNQAVTSLDLEAGKKSDNISVVITPDDASVKTVKWETSDGRVATMEEKNDKGQTVYVVNAVNSGTATVTAKSTTDPTVSASITVNVTKTPVSGITIDKSSMDLFVNEQGDFVATVAPNNASLKGVRWTTSDDKVATVSNGKVTGVGAGTATITATCEDDGTKKAEATVTVSVESEAEIASHNWNVSGTYTVDEYGYTLYLNDPLTEEGKAGKQTVIHVDYDKTQGRHDFYYNVQIKDERANKISSSLVHFQAKDAKFKKQLVSGYKKWDERDSQYIFYAKAVGNNNSLAYAYLYLHKDGQSNPTEGTAVLNAPSGTERKLTIGLSWKLENNVFTIKDSEGKVIGTSRASLNPEHPGYLIVCNGYTFLHSSDPNVKWKKLTTGDFLGTITHEFAGDVGINAGTPDAKTLSITLYCTQAGGAYVYVGDTEYATGTWAVEGGTEIKISMSYTNDTRVVQYESTSTGGMKNIHVEFAMSQQRGPNLSWSVIEGDLTTVLK